MPDSCTAPKTVPCSQRSPKPKTAAKTIKWHRGAEDTAFTLALKPSTMGVTKCKAASPCLRPKTHRPWSGLVLPVAVLKLT
jgi:hypothetical protein